MDLHKQYIHKWIYTNNIYTNGFTQTIYTQMDLHKQYIHKWIYTNNIYTNGFTQTIYKQMDLHKQYVYTHTQISSYQAKYVKCCAHKTQTTQGRLKK